MRDLVLMVVILVAVMAGCAAPGRGAAPDVGPATATTDVGRLRGVVDGDVVRFRGVPYADPPVGARRWTPPRPIAPWTGERDATRSGSACPQEAGQLPEPVSTEDCLFLDVTAPATPRANRPVMVWVHGGSLETGAGSQYDARRLAVEGDVVVVTVNYRLGAMGFLALPGMPGGGTFGLADQQEALRFVRRNAAAFSGAPDNVTLFGESGGGVSTCAQLTAQGARGLFDRAIIQSAVGACGDPIEPGSVARGQPRVSNFSPRPRVERASLAVAARLGCRRPAEAAACLRRVPADRLVREGTGLNLPAVGGAGALLPTGPMQAIEAGRAARVPVLQGFTSDEPSFMLAVEILAGRPAPSPSEYEALVRSAWGPSAGRVLARYPLANFPTPGDAWVAVHADAGWACPSLRLDDALVRRGPTYAYEFADRDSPSAATFGRVPGVTIGATHGAELPFLLDLATVPGALPTPPLTPVQQRLSGDLIRVWSTFARTGVAPVPAWSPRARTGVVFGRPTASAGTTTANLAEVHHCGLWDPVSRPRPRP